MACLNEALWIGYGQSPYSLMRVVLAQPSQLFIITDDFISRLGRRVWLEYWYIVRYVNVPWWPFFIISSSKKVIQTMPIYSQGRALTKSTVLIVSVTLALTEQDARIILTSVF